MTIIVESPPKYPYGEIGPDYETVVPDGVGKLDYTIGPNNKELLSAVLPIRQQFVEAMGWTPEEKPADDLFDGQLSWLLDSQYDGIRDDIDRYDVSDDTLHLGLTDRETGAVIATLRLTRIPSVEESLSFKMLNGNTRMKNEVSEHCKELNESAARGNLWDLTRLAVPVDGSISPTKITAGIMELFATGYGIIKNHTPKGQESDIRWVCNATEIVKELSERLGILFTIASHGKINATDPVEAYVIMVRVQEAVQHIRLNADEPAYQFPYRHMDDGLRKANAL